MKHTPGPWHCDMGFFMSPDDNYIAQIIKEDEEGKIVSKQEQAANARLITAAPDLLAVLSRIAGGEYLGSVLMDEARAAITRATKGTP
jgi:hypothetical protein